MLNLRAFKNTFPMFTLAFAILLPSVAMANESAVDVSANIVATPCTIASGSSEQNVDLGEVWTSQLAKPNDATDWKTFSVSLINCPASTTQVTATMSGTPDITSDDYYLNTGDSKNVAIDIAEATGDQNLSNGKTLTLPVDSNHSATFKMKGRMITPTGKATSGSVTGLMQLTFAFR